MVREIDIPGTVNPVQADNPDDRCDPTHPLMNGHHDTEATEQLPAVAKATSEIPSALEIATIVDHDLWNAVAAMDWESGMQGVRELTKPNCTIPSAQDLATTVNRVTLASVGSMDWERIK
ncbi:hypothetical protein HYS94_05580 [Candidatus Daviesbacteria bacterium]|nr:hypothetical protein [Candidatus Daviesbacteria bacterium]